MPVGYDAAMEPIEAISHAGTVLAYVIRGNASSDSTQFITPASSPFQVGFVVYGAGSAVEPHVHLPVPRSLTGTSEWLQVRSGSCEVDIYDDERQRVATRVLEAGDGILSVGGGHGFRMRSDTVLFEIKQGPYGGEEEKARFHDPAAGQDS